MFGYDHSFEKMHHLQNILTFLMLQVYVTVCSLFPKICMQGLKNFSPTRNKIVPTYILEPFQKEVGLGVKDETWKAQRLHTILLWNTRHDALTAQPALRHYCTSATQPVLGPTAQLQSQGMLPRAQRWSLALTSLAPALTLFLVSPSQCQCWGLSSHSTQHRGTTTVPGMKNGNWSLTCPDRQHRQLKPVIQCVCTYTEIMAKEEKCSAILLSLLERRLLPTLLGLYQSKSNKDIVFYCLKVFLSSNSTCIKKITTLVSYYYECIEHSIKNIPETILFIFWHWIWYD